MTDWFMVSMARPDRGWVDIGNSCAINLVGNMLF
jgi:hypothetical protein